MTGYKYFSNEDGTWCIADQAGWLNGVFDSKETAKEAWDSVKDEKEFDNLFGDICNCYRGNRPITMQDVLDRMPEKRHEFLTPQQKLDKIEEMMHPGYWGTYDLRRDKILEVLGSTRKEWRGGNPFE